MIKQVKLMKLLDSNGNRADPDELYEYGKEEYLTLEVEVTEADEDRFAEVIKVTPVGYGVSFCPSKTDEFAALRAFVENEAGVPIYRESLREWAYA